MSAAEQSSRRLSFYILAVILTIWLYSLWADRVTPMTEEARIHAYLVRVSSEVTGNITAVNVKNNAVVASGDLLFEVDARNYQIALKSAQANLALAGQNIGANTAAVEVAQAKVTDALAVKNNANAQYLRIKSLTAQGVLSQSDLDNAIESRDRTQANFKISEASLVQAKQNLGPAGKNNPQILVAMASLEKAQLDLQRTKITAPSDGVVTNLQLTVGQKASVGTPMLTFIDPRDIWISALVRENSLEHLKKGQQVEFVLDALPGRVLKGRVDSIGWGTGGSNNIDQTTGFLSADNRALSAQRYPVNIIFESDNIPGNIRFGSQATVAFFTGQSTLGELLAKLWIRIVSVWTYVS